MTKRKMSTSEEDAGSSSEESVDLSQMKSQMASAMEPLHKRIKEEIEMPWKEALFEMMKKKSLERIEELTEEQGLALIAISSSAKLKLVF